MYRNYRVVSVPEDILGQFGAAKELRRLWAEEGWDKPEVEGRVRDNQDWELSIRRSLHAVSVWDGKRLIGFGRCTYDIVGTTVYDVVVDKCYRRHQVGQEIMNQLIEAARRHDPATKINLSRWEGCSANEAFYESFGFQHDGSWMVLRPK